MLKVAVVPSIPFSLMYGGGETQALKTMEALRAFDVNAYFLKWEARSVDYDVLHIFGAKYWHTPLIDIATGKGVPVVLSTISYAPPSIRYGIRSMLRRVFTRLVPIETTHRLTRRAMSKAAVLLPNSIAEAEFLVTHFGVDLRKVMIVPNACDEKFADGKPEIFRTRFNISEPFALCVGKIEPRKNQLKLVEAFADWDRRLILIGNAIDNHRSYYEQVMRVVGKSKNITHIPLIPHESGLLASAYAASRVHILLGDNETPGLVSLEAGLAGTQVLVLDCPPVREYLGSGALYIKKKGRNTVREGVTAAWNRKRDCSLACRIRENFTWQKAAEETTKAYQRALAR